ncbi:MAG: helix-turn-helix domain-containing protein [Aeromonadales bacterium]|nr:helix-turn-helix domain-containing protein [Aeromonadales bacterium]MDY2890959.1 helix-turn-helix domain-containing protein [Succinivibrio sp.]
MAAGAIRGRVLSSKCPSRQILRHLTSRWGELVLMVLGSGTRRFSEIKREIEGVSDRMLSQALSDLEADGMVSRKAYNTIPPKVEYSLTRYGAEAYARLHPLVSWLEDNLGGILGSRPSR